LNIKIQIQKTIPKYRIESARFYQIIILYTILVTPFTSQYIHYNSGFLKALAIGTIDSQSAPRRGGALRPMETLTNEIRLLGSWPRT
jgi:NhaP-type Na+/H+ or K+/H+ antiporter